MSLYEKISSREAVIGVIGLGYVGLTLLEAFCKAGFPLIGYDTNKQRVEDLKQGKTPFNFLPLTALLQQIASGRFKPSSDESILDEADVIVISVPTPLDAHQVPNLSSLRDAFLMLSKHLKKDLCIILQSTTYPGTTEEELLPLIQKSGLKLGEDIFLAYVPEVSDPGNVDFDLAAIPKMVGGITPNCQKIASLIFESFECKIIQCSSPKVAEAAKLLQNSFRLVNIALINEMKIAFDQMGLDIWEVIEAASSKPFGFMPFYPGAGVGGDCIPVSPAYLIWEAKKNEGHTTLMELAEHINELSPHFVVEKIVQGLNSQRKSVKESEILVLGVTYKKDVNDIRGAPALKILSLLQERGGFIHYHDPYIKTLPSLNLTSEALDYREFASYDCIVIVTDHSSYDWKKVAEHSRLVVDTRNVLKDIKSKNCKIIKG